MRVCVHVTGLQDVPRLCSGHGEQEGAAGEVWGSGARVAV